MKNAHFPLHLQNPYLHYDLCFDLDGTLIDTAPDLVRVTSETIALVGVPPTSYRLARQEVSFGSKVLIQNALKRAGQSVSNKKLADLRRFFLERYAETIADNSQAFPHVITTLKALKNGGAKLSVCTNKPGYLARPLLDALQMSHFFDVVIGGDEVPIAKPSAHHIFSAAGRPQRGRTLIMVGDSYPDIRAAHNAGVPSILMSYGYTTDKPHKLKPSIILNNFRDIPNILHQI